MRHWICGALYSKPNRSYSLHRSTLWISSAYSVHHHSSLNKYWKWILMKLIRKKCKIKINTFQIACQSNQINENIFRSNCFRFVVGMWLFMANSRKKTLNIDTGLGYTVLFVCYDPNGMFIFTLESVRSLASCINNVFDFDKTLTTHQQKRKTAVDKQLSKI